MIGGSVAKCCGHWIWIANHSQDQLLHRLSVGAWLGVLALGLDTGGTVPPALPACTRWEHLAAGKHSPGTILWT